MYHKMLLVTLSCVLIVICHSEIGDDKSISTENLEWLNSLFILPETRRIRKEYRMLTEKDRNLFNGAFLKLKQDKSVSPNKYDFLVSLHARRSSRNSAHRGPGFLGWHRIFTLLMENALREQEPNITMAYWDCTIDSRLPQPRDTCLWSEDFMGNGDGFVNVGVFKDWSTQADKLYRTVGKIEGPLTDKNISRLFKHSHLGNISYPKSTLKDMEDILELTHNRVHRWVGGEMKVIETAADDPFFFIYHSFTNLIWELFRGHQRSNGVDPEMDWDLFYGISRHHKFAPMGLGNLMAIDGTSEIFAENIVYARRPHCSKINSDCGSPYLYCNVTMEKCMTWTLKEYNMIKENAVYENIPFALEAKEHIDRKLRGVVDLFVNEESHEHNNDGMDQPDHSHRDMGELDSEVHNPGHDEDDDDDHHTHTHNNIHNNLEETHTYSLKHVGIFIQDNLQLVLLASTILVLVILSIISKCLEERHRQGIRRKKYKMDERGKDCQSEERFDNIYTITVTSGSGTPGTFVRFAKYQNLPGKQADNISTPKDTMKTSKGDYLDMDYATRIMNEAKSCDSDLYEISLDSVIEDEAPHDIELEKTDNSIENENFYPTCSHSSSKSCNQRCFDKAAKSIDDVLADYDNLVFRSDPSTRSHSDDHNLYVEDCCIDADSVLPSSYM